MKKEMKRVSIDELLQDSVLTIVQIKEGAEITSGDNLYALCKTQVNRVQKILYEHEYSQSVVHDITYALCALLDETVLLSHRDNPDNRNYDIWLGAPLQVAFFNTHNAGHDLFEKIRERLRDKEKNPLVLSCFDRILGLGFQGCYLDQPQREREHLMLALQEAVRPFEPDETHPIIEPVISYGYWGRKAFLMFATVLAMLFVVILYFLLDQQLDILIKSLLG